MNDQGTGDSQDLARGELQPDEAALRTLTFNLPVGNYDMNVVRHLITRQQHRLELRTLQRLGERRRQQEPRAASAVLTVVGQPEQVPARVSGDRWSHRGRGRRRRSR